MMLENGRAWKQDYLYRMFSHHTKDKGVFAEIGGFLFEKGWSANVHCAKKGGFLLKAIFFCVILNS